MQPSLNTKGKTANSLIITISVIMVFIIFNLSYDYVHLHFAYMGFEDYSSVNIFSWILLLLFTFLGLSIKNRFLLATYFIQLVLAFIPAIIYQNKNLTSYDPVIMHGFVLGIFAFVAKLKLNRIKQIATPKRTFLFLVITFSFAALLFFYDQLKYINFRNLLFESVYETRANFREVDEGKRSIAGYLFSPLSRVLFPAIMIYALNKKKYILFLLAMGGVLVLFLLGALKSVLLGMFMVLAFYAGSYIVKLRNFFLAVLSLCLVASLLDVFAGNYFAIDFFVRRIFFLPTRLELVYTDYFDDNFIYWSHTAIGNLIVEYPFDKQVTYFVGENILNDQGMNANVGVVAEGFMNFGYYGVFINGLLFSVIFKYISMLKVDPRYFGIFVAYLYYFNTSFIFPILASHGLLFLIAYFTVNPRQLLWSNSKPNVLTQVVY